MGPVKRLRRRVQLEFGVLTTLLLFLCSLNAGLNIEKTPSPIKALLGNNVTLPCVLTRDNNRQLDLNLSIVGIRWRKISSDGSEIDVYRFLNLNHEQDRPGSAIDERELRRGNASLTLYHVQKSDEGEYTCTVFVTPNKALAKMIVTVFATPIVNLSSYEITIAPGNEQSVTCYVCRFYPKSVDIRWEKRSASSERLPLDKETCTSVPTQADDGTFNVTSLMSVKPSSIDEDGDEYSCIVSHRSFKGEHVVSFTVTVKEPATSHTPLIITLLVILTVAASTALYLYIRKLPPKISDIVGIDDLVHGKSSNLSWMVSGFKPKDIEIYAYLDRGGQREKIGSWKYPAPQSRNYDAVHYAPREGIELLNQEDSIRPLAPKGSIFSYTCLCSTSIIPNKKDKKAKLVIEIKHAALKTTLTKYKKLNINGDLFKAHILAPQSLKHGEEVTLTCDITKCDPGPLMITWLKGEQVIYKDGKPIDTRYSHRETRDEPHEDNVLKSSSFLTFKAKVKEDHGVKYTCKVVYFEIRKMLKLCHETLITAQPVVEQITSENVGQQIKLSCRVHSFHPKTIENKWFKEKDELPTTDSELDIDDDGLYSTTSILMYVPEKEDIGKTLRCQVDHQSLPNPETREWKLEEQRMNGIKS